MEVEAKKRFLKTTHNKNHPALSEGHKS